MKQILRKVLYTLALVSPASLGFAAETPSPATPQTVAGKPVSMTGTIYALSCLMQGHAIRQELEACSRSSLPHGATLALEELSSGRIFSITSDTPASDPSAKARDFIAEEVHIQGRVYQRSGFSILVPHIIRGNAANPSKKESP